MRCFPIRLLSLGALLTIGGISLAAQPPAGETQRAPHTAREERPARSPADRLLREITLTHAQRTRVHELQQQFAEQRRQLVGARRGTRPRVDREAQQRPREAMRGKLQQLTERQVADLRAVLTPAQHATFDRNVAGMKQRLATRGQVHDERRGERGARRRARADGQGAGLDRHQGGRHAHHGDTRRR